MLRIVDQHHLGFLGEGGEESLAALLAAGGGEHHGTGLLGNGGLGYDLGYTSPKR
ncbi:MAG: hypothetical protein QM703_02530 [Gemmatales bacterium]